MIGPKFFTSLKYKVLSHLSQPLGQDQQNSKQTYCRLPIIIFKENKNSSIKNMGI